MKPQPESPSVRAEAGEGEPGVPMWVISGLLRQLGKSTGARLIIHPPLRLQSPPASNQILQTKEERVPGGRGYAKWRERWK